MLLTTDYGGRTKGRPKAPKAQTPHYCTGQSRASRLVNNTQRVQDSPFDNKKTPMLGPGPTSPEGEGQAHRPTRPSGLGVTGATGRGPPTIRILKPIRSHNSEIPIRIVTSRCRAATRPVPARMLRVHNVVQINTLPHAKPGPDRLDLRHRDRARSGFPIRI